MRVLVITSTFPARAGDGTPGFVLDLARAVHQRQHEVTVVTPRVAGSPRRENMAGVVVRRFAYFPHRFEGLADGAILPNLSRQPWRVVEIIPLVVAMTYAAFSEARRWRPGVVHSHWILPGGLVARLLRVLGLPYIVTVHGADAHGLSARPFALVKRWVLRSASAVVPVSEEIGSMFRGDGPVVDAMPMGVDIEALRSGVGVRQPQPGRVLFIGRLVDKKGLDVALRAVAGAPGVTLRVAGDGPELGRLKALAASLGVNQRVDFMGTISSRRVAEELRLAHVVVIPSKTGAGGDRDGTPVVLAEAMASGVPVIASRIAGNPDHIEHGRTGWLVPPDDVECLAAAFSGALDGSLDIDAWASAAYEESEARFGVSGAAERYIEILESALTS